MTGEQVQGLDAGCGERERCAECLERGRLGGYAGFDGAFLLWVGLGVGLGFGGVGVGLNEEGMRQARERRGRSRGGVGVREGSVELL